MSTILNLPHWNVLEVQEAESNYLITAEYTIHAVYCLKCGCFTDLKRYGKKDVILMDLPIHGHRAGILVPRQRYLCEECGATFSQDLPDKHPDRMMTNRLVEYIERESFRRTFVDIAGEIGVDEATIRNVFRAYLKDLEKETVIATPKWLGIDEVKLLGRYRCIMTNVEKRTIVDLLKSRRKDVVARRLHRLPDRDQIELVVMDMWNPYRQAVQEVLPQAMIVIDKFHVVRMANAALDTVRKELRQSLTRAQVRTLKHDRFTLLKRNSELEDRERFLLDLWTKQFPMLGEAYRLKEDFFAIFDLEDRDKAEKRYAEWEKEIPDEIAPAFKELTTAMENWHDEIFAYFDHRITNAYTEALNGITKLANKIGRGYSFEVLRAKMLYGKGLAVQRRNFGDYFTFLRNHGGRLFPHREPRLWYSYGKSLSTLVNLFEDGEFEPESTRFSE